MIHELVCFVRNTHYWYDSGANTIRAKDLLDKFKLEGEPKQRGAENRLESFLLWLERKHEFREVLPKAGRGHDWLGIPIEFSMQKQSQETLVSNAYLNLNEQEDDEQSL